MLRSTTFGEILGCPVLRSKSCAVGLARPGRGETDPLRDKRSTRARHPLAATGTLEPLFVHHSYQSRNT